jgi:hypothetical protein
MSTLMTTVEDWQEEFFDLVDKVEEPVVRVAGDFAESISDYVPERPAWPFLSQLPTVSEVVENQIMFMTKLVDQQATFARHMVKAFEPVLVRREVKPAPARKPRKAAAPKAAA